MMQPETIRELYLYNHWANQRVLASVEPLSAGEFNRAMGNSFSSVRDTLAHILGAEWIWLERWLGRSPRELLPASDFPNVDALRRRRASTLGKSEAGSSSRGERPSQRSSQIHSAPRIWARVSRTELKLLPIARLNSPADNGSTEARTRWLAQWL